MVNIYECRTLTVAVPAVMGVFVTATVASFTLISFNSACLMITTTVFAPLIVTDKLKFPAAIATFTALWAYRERNEMRSSMKH